MEHYFELPVTINGEEKYFKGRLATFGYVYKFYIIVDGQELVFEKDDEQQYPILSEEGAKGNQSLFNTDRQKWNFLNELFYEKPIFVHMGGG